MYCCKRYFECPLNAWWYLAYLITFATHLWQVTHGYFFYLTTKNIHEGQNLLSYPVYLRHFLDSEPDIWRSILPKGPQGLVKWLNKINYSLLNRIHTYVSFSIYIHIGLFVRHKFPFFYFFAYLCLNSEIGTKKRLKSD